MTGPTSGLIDDFNRPNEDPLNVSSSGAGYSPIPGMAGIGGTNLKDVSNQCAGNGGSISGIMLNPTFNADCETYISVVTLGSAGDLIDLLFRGKDTGAITTIDSYSVRWTESAGTDTINLYRVDNIASTLLASFNQEVTPADSFGAVIIGNSLEAFYKPSAGSWTSLGTATDSTYPLGGKHLISFGGTTVRGDDFGGGNYVPPAGLPFFMQTENLHGQLQGLTGNLQ